MIRRNYKNIISNAYKILTPKEQSLTEVYEGVFGYPCDVYFPVHTPRKGVTYQQTNIFEGHELPYYEVNPSIKDVHFVIPNLMRKESMNSTADQLDNFILKTDGGDARPYIETIPKKELPQYSKVMVKIGSSTKAFFIDQKTVVNGSGGHMLMRMYLSPLTKDIRG